MIIVITVKHFRFSTELISDGIKVWQFTFWKFRFTVFNSLSILNIKSSHFHEISIICIVISIELSDNGYFLLSVDVETLTPSIIVFGAKYLGFFSTRSLKTREKYISFAQLVLLSLYILWGKCVYFSIIVNFTVAIR